MAVPPLPPFAVAPITYKDGGTIGASRLETHPTAGGFANPLIDHVRALWDQAEALRVAVNGVSTNVGLLGSPAPVGALITGNRDDGTFGMLPGAPGVLRYNEENPHGVEWSSRLPSPQWQTFPVSAPWMHVGIGLRFRELADGRVELAGNVHIGNASDIPGNAVGTFPGSLRGVPSHHAMFVVFGGFGPRQASVGGDGVFTIGYYLPGNNYPAPAGESVLVNATFSFM